MVNRAQFITALWVGKLAARLIGLLAPSRGTNKSGEFACRIMPRFLEGFAGIDPVKTIFITGTNGKSTSNNMVVHAFRTAGRTVATNLEGANQKTGIATTLLKNSTLLGRMKAEYLILEVDERNMERVRAAIPAKHIAVTNIQKDQVQRNGDPDYIYQKIKRSLDEGVTLFVNNEEPRSASLARHVGRSVSFGVSQLGQTRVGAGGRSQASVGGSVGAVPVVADHGGDNERMAAAPDGAGPEFAVTMACPVCHDALDFSWYNLANVGRFSCAACGFSSVDKPDYLVDSVDAARQRFTVAGLGFHLEYDASHFLYNYALCCAIATESGIGAGDLARAFQTFTNVGGRLEEFTYADKKIRYVRMKQENPETVQSGLDDVAKDPRPKVFMVGLQLVHDFTPHYTNTAYFFDCDVDALLASGVEACICFGSVNCHDAATRLAYAGFPREKIIVVDSDEPADVMAALTQCQATQAYLITMLGMYESLRAWADRHGQDRAGAGSSAGPLVGQPASETVGEFASAAGLAAAASLPGSMAADSSVVERASGDEALLARARDTRRGDA